MSPQELQPPPRGRPPLETGGEEGETADCRLEEQVSQGVLTGGLPAVIQAQAEPLPLLQAGEQRISTISTNESAPLSFKCPECCALV